MLKGIDISHHNEAYILKDPDILRIQDFILMKATEGISYIDKYKDIYLSYIDKYQSIGFYHYCRPERGNAPEAEASHFLNSIRPYIGRAILAIDVEADALLYPNIDKWVYDWLEAVYTDTRVRPLVYCSESQAYRFRLAAKNNYGLWCARWGAEPPRKGKIKPWKFWALWQNASGRLDRDIFNGDSEAWFAYAKGERAI